MDYNSKILLVGSCFVENMGEKLEYFKFQNRINPLGILFHTSAIAGFFKRVTNQLFFTEADLVFYNERWHCLDAHSIMSGTDQETVLENLNTALKQAIEFLQNSTHVIITLGTAWGYRYKKTEKLVANCHKIPQQEFDKELAKTDVIYADLSSILISLNKINPKIKVVFTVSPVRHLKDGFIENQRSKAHLIAAVHALVKNHDQAEYFPSYEIMMDELRDYRFYERDLLHPNALAVDYIWEKFTSVYLSPQAQQWTTKIEEVQKGIAHRPFDQSSAAHLKFLKNLERKKKYIEENQPNIRF
jgi:hypothetical protein